jgi:hypothetical protein
LPTGSVFEAKFMLPWSFSGGGRVRSEVLRDLPTVADSVPGYEASAWYGIGAPKGTPVEIIDRLNRGDQYHAGGFDSEGAIY